MNKRLQFLDKKVDQFIHDPEQSLPDLMSKKLLFYWVSFNCLGVLIITPLGFLLKLYTFLFYGYALLIMFTLTFFSFRLQSSFKLLFAVQMVGYILLTAFVAAYMGGLLNSGGIMITGMVCVMMSTLLRSIRITLAVASSYILTLLILIVFESNLTIHPDLMAENNRLFFTINLTWLTISPIFFVSYFFWSQQQYEDQEKERLKELEATKTRLFTNITHEFRTPLTLILGTTEEIKVVDQKSKDHLNTIHNNGRRLLRLVNQMLNMAKLDAGVMDHHPIQADIVSYLQFIVDTFQPVAQHKQILLNYESTETAFIMDFDPEKLEEIMSNLLSNALKHSMAGSQVKVSLMIHKDNEENSMTINVSDKGSGIAKEKIDLIFDRFYQVEEASRHHQEGSGIGLALVKENIRLMGGEVRVESKVGVGTTFSVHLPVTHKASLADPYDGKSFNPLPEYHIDEPDASWTDGQDGADKPLLLVVEDHPEMMQLISSIVEKDYRVEKAFNGLDGLHQATELIPDIIISDVMMPRMDGFEFLEQLKSNIRTSHIPVIMLTARADMVSKIEGLEKGAEAYLTKPFSKPELLVRLKKLLEQRKLLQDRYISFNLQEDAADQQFLAEDQFMKEVNRILEAHLDDESYGVDDLARSLAMSRSQLYRKFHALTDTTVDKYLLKYRLHRAMELVKTTDRSISQVALEVGIPNPSYFSRVFKDEFGIAPSRVRKADII